MQKEKFIGDLINYRFSALFLEVLVKPGNAAGPCVLGSFGPVARSVICIERVWCSRVKDELSYFACCLETCLHFLDIRHRNAQVRFAVKTRTGEWIFATMSRGPTVRTPGVLAGRELAVPANRSLHLAVMAGDQKVYIAPQQNPVTPIRSGLPAGCWAA